MNIVDIKLYNCVCYTGKEIKDGICKLSKQTCAYCEANRDWVDDPPKDGFFHSLVSFFKQEEIL